MNKIVFNNLSTKGKPIMNKYMAEHKTKERQRL